MPPRRCRRTCCNPGTCLASNTTDSTRSRTRLKNEIVLIRRVFFANRFPLRLKTLWSNSDQGGDHFVRLSLGPTFTASGRFMEYRKVLRLFGNWLGAALSLGVLGSAVASGTTASAQ